jgi:hypothetical protein
MRHPLDFLPETLRKPVFWAALLLTVACFAIFQGLDQPLKTPASTGIVAFELAGSTARSTQMIASWDARARNFAAFGLGFDFLFMPIYATTLSAATLLARKRRPGAWSQAGAILGWSSYLATLFDAVENIALFSSLNGSLGNNPQIALGCASLKFGLILLSLAYGLVGWLLPAR